MGDMNVNVVDEIDTEILGKFGTGIHNKRGEKCVHWCMAKKTQGEYGHVEAQEKKRKPKLTQ